LLFPAHFGIWNCCIHFFFIVKVAYFNVSRNAFVEVAERRHRDGLQNLKEAREWAEWSAKDREKRLPKLTQQQEEQLKNYLKIVEQHGVNKAPLMSNGTEVCRDCPIFRNSSTVAMKESATS
jgi:hypothetical protein